MGALAAGGRGAPGRAFVRLAAQLLGARESRRGLRAGLTWCLWGASWAGRLCAGTADQRDGMRD
eukprot:343761-Prymnesium_polylepis.1